MSSKQQAAALYRRTTTASTTTQQHDNDTFQQLLYSFFFFEWYTYAAGVNSIKAQFLALPWHDHPKKVISTRSSITPKRGSLFFQLCWRSLFSTNMTRRMPYTCRALRMSLNLSYWVEWVKLGVRWFAYASTCSATFHIRFSSIVDYATRLRIRCSACFGLSRLPHPPPAWELAGYVCQEQTLLLATHISCRPCMFWISRLSLQRKGLYAASLFRWRDEWVDTNLLGAQHVFVKWLSLQHWRLSLAAQTTLACLFFFTVDPVVVETLSLFLEPLRPK